MKTIKINNFIDIPKNYTGIADRSDGTKKWYLNGKLHRTDGPALELSNGTKCWYLNGKRHRIDGPTVEYPHGSKHWYLNGKLHRIDGPAIELSNGTKCWYLNGKHLGQQKIEQFVDEFGYPIETAIKLTYLLEINNS